MILPGFYLPDVNNNVIYIGNELKLYVTKEFIINDISQNLSDITLDTPLIKQNILLYFILYVYLYFFKRIISVHFLPSIVIISMVNFINTSNG